MTAGGFDAAPYRARLAQPPRQPGPGRRDRAFCVDGSGAEHELFSGHDDEMADLARARLHELGFFADCHLPEIAAHVEMKAAVWMQQHSLRDTNLVLDRPPCVGPLSCDTVLSGVAPAWTRQPSSRADCHTVVAYWRHEHVQAPVVARTPDQVNGLVDQLLGEPFDHSVAALYVIERPLNPVGLPDHELRVAVNAATNTGALRYMGGPGTWFSAGPPTPHEEVCYHHMGRAALFPRNSELPIPAIRTAVGEFAATGGERPTCINWQHFTVNR